MSLFSTRADSFNGENRSVLTKMEDFYTLAMQMNQSFWAEGLIDTRFHGGDQTIFTEQYGVSPDNRRRSFNFNHIRRVVSMVSGYQRKNRKSIIVVPVENGDSDTADQFTKIMTQIANSEGILETFSEAFEGSLITGLNLLQLWIDYRPDPVSGCIRVDSCPYNSFLIDPFYKRADLSDCQAIWKRTHLNKQEVMSLLPQFADQMYSYDRGDSKDGKFNYLPESFNLTLKEKYTYDEFYYRDYRKQQLLVNAENGEVQEWHGQDEDRLRDFLQVFPNITVHETIIPTVNLAIVVESHVIYNDRNPMGLDIYPFVPVTCYFHPEMPEMAWRIQGLVRGLRDPQFLFNRRLVILLDRLEAQITSGFKYKENALVNPNDIFLTGNGKGLCLKEEAQMSDVEQIVPIGLQAGELEVNEFLGKQMIDVVGLNEELMSSAADSDVGITTQLRMGAALTTLQGIFDQADRSLKLLGKNIMLTIQQNYTPGKIKKILEGEEPTEQFYNKAFGMYDCVVEEGLVTSTQKQLHLAQLLSLKAAGVLVPDDAILDACTLQNKKKLLESIKQGQQQQQEQMAQRAQLEMQEISARIQLAQSRAGADQGLAVERISKVETNESMAEERRAQAVRDENAAALDLIKSIKELESVDVANFKKLVEAMNIIKAQEAANAAEPKQTNATV